jgi:hypothetical protein
MRRENKRHRQHRSGGEQFDLFRLPRVDCEEQRLAWEARTGMASACSFKLVENSESPTLCREPHSVVSLCTHGLGAAGLAWQELLQLSLHLS